MDKIHYFNALNNTKLTYENLLCGLCSSWLSTPIFITPYGKNLCACAKDKGPEYYRNTPLEQQLSGSQYPCLRFKCFASSSLEEFTEHEKLCHYAPIKCPFCEEEDLDENDIIKHLLKHKKHKDNEIASVEEYEEVKPQVKLRLNSFKRSVHVILINSVYFIAKFEEHYVTIAQLYSKVNESTLPFTLVQETATGEVRTKGKVCSMRRMFNQRVATAKLRSNSLDATLFFAAFEDYVPYDECPICLEPLGGEVYPCVNHHVVCMCCAEKITKCPQCRSPMQKECIPSRMLRLRNIPVRCENIPRGCLVYATNAQHANERAYKPYECPWPKCQHYAHQEAIISHMKQEHSQGMFHMGYALMSNMSTPIFIEHNGNLFEVFIDSGSVGGKLLIFYVKMCLDDRQAHKYRYVVKFFSHGFTDELLRGGNFVLTKNVNVTVNPVTISIGSVIDYIKKTKDKQENFVRFKVYIQSPKEEKDLKTKFMPIAHKAHDIQNSTVTTFAGFRTLNVCTRDYLILSLFIALLMQLFYAM